MIKPYAKRLVREMPRKGDCRSAEITVPLHHQIYSFKEK